MGKKGKPSKQACGRMWETEGANHPSHVCISPRSHAGKCQCWCMEKKPNDRDMHSLRGSIPASKD